MHFSFVLTPSLVDVVKNSQQCSKRASAIHILCIKVFNISSNNCLAKGHEYKGGTAAMQHSRDFSENGKITKLLPRIGMAYEMYGIIREYEDETGESHPDARSAEGCDSPCRIQVQAL